MMERFRILGPLEFRSGDAWAGIGAPKWRARFAAPLLDPRRGGSPHPLEERVWGGGAPGSLGVVGPDELDAMRFAGLVAAGRKALSNGETARAFELLTAALALFRGPPLADVPPSDLVTIEAGRLEESRVAALGLRIEAEIESGNAASAIGELLGLTADHPLREELWALLMRALRAAGRQAEALEAYERVRTVIGDELGVDPGPGLRQLYQAILAR